jgi:large subunit ribosomal protein L17
MFRNMVTSLFKYDRIRTTDAKAKEIRRWADQLVTLAKRGDLHARRQAMSIIREKEVVHKLFEDAPKRFADVNGGYTRVVKIGFRPGDAASVSLVELVTPEPKKKKKPRRKKKAAPVAETQSAAVTEAAETKAPDADVSVEAALSMRRWRIRPKLRPHPRLPRKTRPLPRWKKLKPPRKKKTNSVISFDDLPLSPAVVTAGLLCLEG